MPTAAHLAAQVDLWEAVEEGRMEEVQLVCDFCPERVNELQEQVPTALILLLPPHTVTEGQR